MARHTLVIDDDSIVLFLMRKLVGITKFTTDANYYDNSLLALDYFKEVYNPNEQFILFLDINMPLMNGWDFLKAIEAFAKPDNTYVFIITSSTDQPDADKGRSNMFVKKFMVKPVLAENLLALKEWLESEDKIT